MATSDIHCDCGAETLRIISLCQRCPAQQQPASSSSSSSSLTASTPTVLAASLPATLKTAHSLVQHWGYLNGCPNADSHMSAGTLCSMTCAIGLILHDHEIAVDSIGHRQHSLRQHQHSTSTAVAVCQSDEPKVSIGKLELEPLEQMIVIQESVKRSIIRLATMLQDIEEEAALMSRDQAAFPLHNGAVKRLITRLFRLLGIVDQIVPT